MGAGGGGGSKQALRFKFARDPAKMQSHGPIGRGGGSSNLEEAMDRSHRGSRIGGPGGSGRGEAGQEPQASPSS